MRKLFCAAAITMALAAPMTFRAAVAADLRIALASEPTSMDPHYHNLGPNNAFASQLFNPLVCQDENQKLKPCLATSWKAIDDRTWEFKLREGVKFSDGSPFTADDVISTMQRAPNVPNSPSSFGLYIKGKTFTKVDDFTVRVTTAEPYPLMPEDLSTVEIISKKAAEGATTADFNSGKAAVGTGEFQLVQYTPKDHITIKRNPNYWGKKSPWDNVTFKPITSETARVAALLAGDVDVIEGVPTVDIAELKKNPKINLSHGVSNRVIYLAMDQFRKKSPFVTDADGKSPLLDQRVRHAMSVAINRPAIVSRIMEGAAIPAGQLLPPGFFGVSPTIHPPKYDPKEAKKLLAEAGYPNGFGITLHTPNNRYTNDSKIAEAVASMLTRVGIKTKVEALPWNVFASRASHGGPDKAPEFSFILVGWGSGTGEASSPLKSLLATWDPKAGMGASNRGRYSNPEMDKVLAEALATVDNDKRAKLLAKATEIAMKDVGIIPLHYQVNYWATRADLAYRPRTDERTVADDVIYKPKK